MKYFDSLPSIVETDPQGNYIAAKNLMVRVSIVQKLINDPAIYYQYDIQDGDTPEIIASKYYNDPYRFWLVLLPNEILDPQWQWPLKYEIFEQYINDKYAVVANTAQMTPLAYTQATTYAYQKIIATTDSTTQNTTTNIYVVDSATYNNVVVGSQTTNLQPTKWNNHAQITINTSKNIQSIYDWEYQQNEARRSIKLINAAYVGQFEQEFNKLVNNNNGY